MSVTVEQKHTENYYISMSIETANYYSYTYNYYLISVYPLYKDGTAGYPIKTMNYPIDEKEKATRTYNRYCKKYI